MHWRNKRRLRVPPEAQARTISKRSMGGGGGGSGGFTPEDLTDLWAWYDAKQVAVEAGNPVGTWADLSGNSRDLIAAGDARPTLNGTGLGGQPAIDFDGTNDILTCTTSVPAGSTGLSLFVVWQMDADASEDAPLFYVDSLGAGDISLRNQVSRALRFNHGAANIDFAGAMDSNAHVAGLRSISTVGTNLYYDSTTAVTNGTGNDWATASSFSMGTSGTLNMKGVMAEMVITTGSLSDADVTSVIEYLADKWGITLAES